MNELIIKLIKKEKITDKDIEQELYEICDRVHGSCGCDCPVYEYGLVNKDGKCAYYRNGKKMLELLRETLAK